MTITLATQFVSDINILLNYHHLPSFFLNFFLNYIKIKGACCSFVIQNFDRTNQTSSDTIQVPTVKYPVPAVHLLE